MRNVWAFVGFVCLITVQWSCSATRNFTFGNGVKLSYDIIGAQGSVRMNVDVIEFDKSVKFKYTIAEQGIEGKITVTPEAKRSATELYYLFDGQDKVLTNQMCLWLSTGFGSKMVITGENEMSIRQGFVKKTYTYKRIEEKKMLFNVNGKPTKLNVVCFEDTANQGLKFWMWTQAGKYLIVRMDVGWQMILKNIET
jgi:hypothetical protein